jgi:hypothetical protein
VCRLEKHGAGPVAVQAEKYGRPMERCRLHFLMLHKLVRSECTAGRAAQCLCVIRTSCVTTAAQSTVASCPWLLQQREHLAVHLDRLLAQHSVPRVFVRYDRRRGEQPPQHRPRVVGEDAGPVLRPDDELDGHDDG